MSLEHFFHPTSFVVDVVAAVVVIDVVVIAVVIVVIVVAVAVVDVSVVVIVVFVILVVVAVVGKNCTASFFIFLEKNVCSKKFVSDKKLK